MTREVRPARADDVDRLVAMLVDQSPWRELRFDEAHCRSLIAPHLCEIWVAVDPSDVPAGFLRWRADGMIGQPYLSLLAVAPEYQRAGVGRRLVSWLEEELFERRGAANLFLCVSTFNEAARAFYRALGYQDVGVLKSFLRPGFDEMVMRKSRRPLLE